MNIYVNSKMTDEGRRAELYRGAIFVHAPSSSALKLCRLAQGMIEEAFGVLTRSRFTKSICRECGSASRSEAEIYSSSTLKAIHPGNVVGGRLRSSQDVFRCSANADSLSGRLSEIRHRIRLSSASRHGGIPPPFANSTGGCRFTTSIARTAWRSTLIISGKP